MDSQALAGLALLKVFILQNYRLQVNIIIYPLDSILTDSPAQRD